MVERQRWATGLSGFRLRWSLGGGERRAIAVHLVHQNIMLNMGQARTYVC